MRENMYKDYYDLLEDERTVGLSIVWSPELIPLGARRWVTAEWGAWVGWSVGGNGWVLVGCGQCL